MISNKREVLSSTVLIKSTFFHIIVYLRFNSALQMGTTSAMKMIMDDDIFSLSATIMLSKIFDF